MSSPIERDEPVVERDEQPQNEERPLPETSASENPIGEPTQTSEKSDSNVAGNVLGFVQKHWGKILYVIAIIIVIIIIMVFSSRERFEQPFYLDQIAMKNSDPTFFKYTGRERDILGESSRDYYLQNHLYAKNFVAPQRLENDDAFINQTDYLDMPSKWRPEAQTITDVPALSIDSSEQFVAGGGY